jgi:uncharacterized protein (DUF1778 family)
VRDILNCIEPEVRDLMDQAARARGKSRTDCILDTVRLATEEALLDQALRGITPEACTEFVARLDRAPTLNPRLQKTLQTPASWDRQ